jgi:hypothetical protein
MNIHLFDEQGELSKSFYVPISMDITEEISIFKDNYENYSYTVRQVNELNELLDEYLMEYADDDFEEIASIHINDDGYDLNVYGDSYDNRIKIEISQFILLDWKHNYFKKKSNLEKGYFEADSSSLGVHSTHDSITDIIFNEYNMYKNNDDYSSLKKRKVSKTNVKFRRK